MKFDQARQQGAKTDKYIFTRKNNKFASKDYGKKDPKQYNTSPKTDDAKDYDKAVKTGEAYLTKVNTGYKIKI